MVMTLPPLHQRSWHVADMKPLRAEMTKGPSLLTAGFVHLGRGAFAGQRFTLGTGSRSGFNTPWGKEGAAGDRGMLAGSGMR